MSSDPFLDGPNRHYGTNQSSWDSTQSTSQSTNPSNWSKKQARLSLSIICVLTLTVIGLAIALGLYVRESDGGNDSPVIPGLEGQIRLDDLMTHMKAIQSIADSNNGNRAVGTSGFNATVDYVVSQLEKTNLKVFKQYFTTLDWDLIGTPSLQIMVDQSTSQSKNPSIKHSVSDQQTFNYVYSVDYTVVSYSGSINAVNQPLSFIPNGGCSSSDYQSINQSIGVLNYIKCANNATLSNRITFATRNGGLGLIVYATPDGGGQLINTRAPQTNLLPVVFMTYASGAPLALMSQADHGKSFTVSLSINQSRTEIVLTNVCADTANGDPSSLIILGSHTDSVKTGSGMNDNASGTSGNLVWAQAVSRLIDQGEFHYQSKVRFCWWAGEELGLLGSRYYVAAASQQSAVGERLIDIQCNFNYDMMASPNYLYGVLDAYQSVGVNESSVVGSKYLTDLFTQYLSDSHLPITSKEFNGRSDYGSYLEYGVPAGGISAFIDRLKSESEVDYYTEILGPGKGGNANIPTDPCYHQHCDRLSNINPDVFLNIAKAQAWVLDQVGPMDTNELRIKLGRPALESINQSVIKRTFIDQSTLYAETWE